MEVLSVITADLPFVDQEALTQSIQTVGLMPTVLRWGRQLESYDNNKLAGRLYLHSVEEKFARNSKEYVHRLKHRLLPDISAFFLQHSEAIDAEIQANSHNNLNIDLMAAGSFIKTYLAKEKPKQFPVESIQFLFMRIAVQLYYQDGLDQVLQAYREQSAGLYTHASPTIMNAGMMRLVETDCAKCRWCLQGRTCREPALVPEPRNQMSSCFLLTMSDSTQSIVYMLKACGLISKNKGGIGLDISRIRHSEIGDTGKSKGLVPLMYLFNALIRYFDQEGLRKGACNVYTRAHHIDLIHFCDATLKTGDHYTRTHSLNTTIWFPWLFWKRVEEQGKWTLFCPNKTRDLNDVYGIEFNQRYEEYEQEFVGNPKYKKYYIQMQANDILKHIIRCQTKSGMPYVMHGDACNFKSNQRHRGYLRLSNLCLEITEWSSETEIPSCNLASLSVRAFVIGKSGDLKLDFDWAKHSLIVRHIVTNLNRVIALNHCPLPEIKLNNDKMAPMGIGVTGFADALYLMDLHFEHSMAAKFNEMYFASLYFNATAQSVQEAILHGKYSSFDQSPMAEGKMQYDLWRDEYTLLSEHGLLGKKPLRKPEDDIPMEPSEWCQQSIPLYNKAGELIDIIQPTNQDLKRCVMKYGEANSLKIAIMPTATTSTIMMNTEMVEAPMTNIFERQLMNGNYPVLNAHLEKDLRAIGVWNDKVIQLIDADSGSISKLDRLINAFPHWFPDFTHEEDSWDRLFFLQTKYKTMWELPTRLFMMLAAKRARYVDQSQSMNIYMQDPDYNKMKAAHLTGFKLGLKTGMYYLRQEPVRGNSKITVDPRIIDLVEQLGSVKVPTVVKEVAVEVAVKPAKIEEPDPEQDEEGEDDLTVNELMMEDSSVTETSVTTRRRKTRRKKIVCVDGLCCQ